MWNRTLGAELAEHRYPDSPRRIRVLRCRRDLDRHGYWLRAPLLPNRHDNPLSRVSTALSTGSQTSRQNPETRCTATLLAALSNIRMKSLGPPVPGPSRPAAKDPPIVCSSAPRIRSDDHTNEPGGGPRGKACHQPSNRQQTNRTTSNSDSLTGRLPRTLSPECQQPSHQSVKNPPTAGQTQRQRTRECLTAGHTRKQRTSRMAAK